MDESGLIRLAIAVLAPVALGLLTLLLPKRMIGARTILAWLGMGGAFASLAWVWIDGAGVGAGVGLAPSVGLSLTFNPDALGVFFGLLVSGIGALIVLYARGYFGRDEASLFRFYPTLGLFATAMMGLVLSDDLIGMLVFWELTSLSSFLLIGWNRDSPRAVRLALQALATTGLGGMALLGGLVALGATTGEWTFAGVNAALASGEASAGGAVFGLAFALIFLGAATKSAQWPFHYWLPGAMAAPTPVSAYLHSATMVKAGVYLFARFYPGLSTLAWWGPALTVIGGSTMLWAAFVALRSHELKRIFAYTTVSQLGLLTCAYGLGAWSYKGEANLIWPVTQIFNHALYKAPLFIMAGAIMHVTGRKLLPELRGLWRSHPLYAGVLLVAAYAMAGGPFTLSFVAKEAFFYQAVHAAQTSAWVWAVGVAGILTAALNVAIFVRILTTFAGRGERIENAHAPERGFWGVWLWLPAALLAGLQVVGGVAPGWFGDALSPVETHALYWEHLPSVIYAVTHPSLPLAMSGLAIALGAAIGLSPLWRRVWEDPHNRLFPSVDRALEGAGWAALSRLQNGNFRVYAVLCFAALLVGIVAAGFYQPALLSLPRVAPLGAAGFAAGTAAVITTVMICVSALLMPFVRSRVNRVLMLGAAGMAVTMMYLLYQAPDLVLTQLMFELISIMLFLLVLRMLPEEPRVQPKGGRLGRAAIGGSVGLVIGFLVLHAAETPDFNPGVRLGDWFVAHSYDGLADTAGRGGGGLNVVNVILVDHRGYDTLGEITVLAIVALAVLSLVGSAPAKKLRAMMTRGLDPAPDQFHPEDPKAVNIGPQPTLQSSLFAVSMRLILPLALIFAGYVFFKGHNAPGGGFIAGLTASVALVVFRMAMGPDSIKKLLPIKPAPMAALGLGIALFSAAWPMAIGDPFLRSYHDVTALPGGGSYHWASVMLFDLGVLTVVVAASVGIINRLTEEVET